MTDPPHLDQKVSAQLGRRQRFDDSSMCIYSVSCQLRSWNGIKAAWISPFLQEQAVQAASRLRWYAVHLACYERR